MRRVCCSETKQVLKDLLLEANCVRSVKLSSHHESCNHKHGRSNLRFVDSRVQERGEELRVVEGHVREPADELEGEEFHILPHAGNMVQLDEVP